MYNRLDKTATKKIKDRGIHWQQSYHEKSLTLKKRFDKDIGPMSYLRYEGHDTYTNSDYYVVVGPSVDDGKKKFFAGIKKLPKDPNATVYSPYGEYFPTIVAAMAYAGKKWGVPFEQGLPEYSEETLAPINIPEHIK